MNPIQNLQELLKSIGPKLEKGEYVYCIINKKTLQKLRVTPLLTLYEEEGITLVMEKSKADSLGLEYEQIWNLVTLSVYSSLSAVGFIAAITQHLADYGISTNVISGFYHDHLLVPSSKGKRVIELLKELQKSNA